MCSGVPKGAQIHLKSSPRPSWSSPWALSGAPDEAWEASGKAKEAPGRPREAPSCQNRKLIKSNNQMLLRRRFCAQQQAPKKKPSADKPFVEQWMSEPGT